MVSQGLLVSSASVWERRKETAHFQKCAQTHTHVHTHVTVIDETANLKSVTLKSICTLLLF